MVREHYQRVVGLRGSTEAKIVDIWASVVLPDEENIHSETLTDKNTLAENDYILEVGKTYNLTVTYIATGGSKYPGFTSTDGINLIYDSEALKIAACEQERWFYSVVRYDLECNYAVSYAAIIVEVDGQYSFTVIISAK